MKPKETKIVHGKASVKASKIKGKKKKQLTRPKKTQKSPPRPKTTEAAQSLDEFLERWSDNDDDEEEAMEEEAMEEDKEASSSSEEDLEESRKNYLKTLQSKDPEFYEFLKENDEKLLNFDEDDSDSGSNDDDDEVKKEKFHRPPPVLEVASDESDFELEPEEEEGKKKKTTKSSKNVVTKELLDKWTTLAESNEAANMELLTNMVEAFRSAVATIGPSNEEIATKFVVNGGPIFNGVVRLCVTLIEGVFRKVLRLDSSTKNVSKSKRWSKVNKSLKSYTGDLIKLLGNVGEKSVVCVLLKHVHRMIPFYAAMPKATKILTKTLIELWSTADEETIRILAFMCILRLTQATNDLKDTEVSPILEPVMKQMYMAFVRNCKFTSPSTRPNIAFMRRSLAELMNLDHNLTYHHAFVYIRQLAIHLRNAITLQKKDSSIKAVYNWQFVHCLHLWAHLLGSFPSPILEPLIHPLVQIMTGTISLVFVAKYYPLRFHVCKMLTNLSRETGKFVPILPYYTEILDNYNFNKKSKKLTMKPIDFGSVLKCSKSQLVETGFKDTVMDQIYAGILEYLHDNAHKISFPELVAPAVFRIKDFLKRKNKVVNYGKKMKQIMDKIAENAKWIENKRRNVSFELSDDKAVDAWELKARSGAPPPPLSAFYLQWKKVRDHEILKIESRIEAEQDAYDYIPSVIKKKKKSKPETEFKGDILEGDEDDDDELADEERFKLKKERNKRKLEEDDEEKEDSSADEEPTKKKRKDEEEEETEIKDEDDDDDDDQADRLEDLNLNDLESESDENESDDDDSEEEDSD